MEFVDIQEGDAISEPSDEEVVAHSRETKTYEHAEVSDSEESEDPSRLPPADMGADTYGIDVDLAINNGIADESDGCDEGLIMDNEGHDASLSNNIETSLGNFVEVGENRRREIKQVEEPKTEIIPLEASKTENKRAEKVKTESRQLEAQKVDGMIEEDSEGDEKEGNQVEDQKESEKEHLEKQTEILADDDYSDDTTEVDKLLEKDNTKVEKKVTHQKAKSKMVSSGTQVHEVEPLLNASQTPSPSETPSPEPRESPQNRRQFTPREYPGKAVKSIAIGTDDEYPTVMHKKSQQAEVRPGETQKRGKGSRTPLGRSIENGVKTSDKASTPPSTSTPTVNRSNRQAKSDPPTSRSSRQPPGTRGSQSSDAMFFKSRLSQTSKRRPKRHVWLVRDSEIHRLIAEKAAILRRYKEEGITGERTELFLPWF